MHIFNQHKEIHFFVFQDMKWMLVILCGIMFIPITTYAQSEANTLQIDQEQYIVERTGMTMVKIFGNIDDKYAKVSVTHTNPEGESLTHSVMVTKDGYYEFHFSHDWKSIRGNYDVSTSINDTQVATISYEVIQDPSYKTDEEVKQEYYIEKEDSNETLEKMEDKPKFLIVEAEAIEGSKTITIKGTARSNMIPIVITVVSPNESLVSIDQISPEVNGSFTSTIKIGGPMWKQDGIYSITAQQGSDTINKTTIEVEIVDGAVIPEFGTIASLVLVIAISSIIILSTKSRLRLQEKI